MQGAGREQRKKLLQFSGKSGKLKIPKVAPYGGAPTGADYVLEKRRFFMMEKLSDDLKKIFLAGVGAVSVTAEKSGELIDKLVEKGQLTVEQGKVLNEELKHTAKEKVKSALDIDDSAEGIAARMDKMTPEELAVLRAKLDALQGGDASKEG